MAYTIRNLVTDAYRESGVLGIGQTLQDYQLQEGVGSLNLILDEIYAGNNAQATVAQPVTFDGNSNYTIGPVSAVPTDPIPDIELPLMPVDIDEVIISIGGVRSPCTKIDPITYHNRSLDVIGNQSPWHFYFERTFPLGTLRFYEGTPSGEGEIIYKPNMVDVGANTDYKYYPRELKPYLVYSLAARVAENNAFDPTSIQIRANTAWARYREATYRGQSYHVDNSAPIGMDNGDKYNIYRGL
jgi:hypothetical protein